MLPDQRGGEIGVTAVPRCSGDWDYIFRKVVMGVGCSILAGVRGYLEGGRGGGRM